MGEKIEGYKEISPSEAMGYLINNQANKLWLLAKDDKEQRIFKLVGEVVYLTDVPYLMFFVKKSE